MAPQVKSWMSNYIIYLNNYNGLMQISGVKTPTTILNVTPNEVYATSM